MLNRYAMFSSTPCTSRKSSVSAPGTVAAVQVAPPSIVFRYVPRVPLAQTVFSFAAHTPRSDAVLPLDCAVKLCANAAPAKKIKKPLLIRFSPVYARWAPCYDRTDDPQSTRPTAQDAHPWCP